MVDGSASGEVREEQDRLARRHRAVLESVGEGIYGLDAQGKVTFVSAEAARLFGADPADLVGRPLHRLVHHSHADGSPLPLEECQVHAAMRDGAARQVPADVFWRADGSCFPVRYLSTPILRGAEVEGAVVVFRDMTEERRLAERMRREDLARQALGQRHLALLRVATAVAADGDPQLVLDLVAREMAGLLGAEAALVARFHGDVARPVGWWGARQERMEVGIPLDGGGALARVRRSGRPARIDDYSRLDGEPIRRLAGARGYRSSVAAPVMVGGRLWGAVLVATTRPAPLGEDAEARLCEFAELVGMATANAAARADLMTQATTDSLTGLANHRAFHDRLGTEVLRARRYGRDLCLVLLDLDHFKDVNDRGGHQTGDGVLAEVARSLLALRRAGETMGRVGGDEFAWLLPETDADGGERAAERARAAVAANPLAASLGPTLSAGVCDLGAATTAAELYRLADAALYRGKGEGRDRVRRHVAGHAAAAPVARPLAPGLVRALGEAVDARDPGTQRHSERVAEMAMRIARERGWPEDRQELIRIAGLAHDVGKIGVPEAVLRKRGPLTAEEYGLVTSHAALGAEILDGVLTDEQVAWIRGHHERWDGTGYPDALSGGRIPDGALVLGLADALDAMTSIRPYRPPLTLDAAMDEVRARAGTQFCAASVAALVRLSEGPGL